MKQQSISKYETQNFKKNIDSVKTQKENQNKTQKQTKVKSSFNKGRQQWADHLTEKAKHDNYPARSVYKLIEIQNRFKVMKKGDIILDLGCSPGSWLIYAAKTIGDKGIVIGVDLEKIQIQLPSNAFPIQGDVFNINQDSFGLIGSMDFNSKITNRSDLNDSSNNNIINQSNLDLNNSRLNTMKKYDVVLSDMAPSTTGRKDVDAARSFELCGAALKTALEWLEIGGNFVCKIFQGSEFKEFEQNVKTKFKQTSIFKPESCRAASKEIYIIGKGKI